MRTVAYCMSTRCQDVDANALEQYWRVSLVHGSRSNLWPKPEISYAEALADIEEQPEETFDSEKVEMLNRTMLISDSDWQTQVRTLGGFERMEKAHSKWR